MIYDFMLMIANLKKTLYAVQIIRDNDPVQVYCYQSKTVSEYLCQYENGLCLGGKPSKAL